MREQSLKMDMKDRNERFIHCDTGFLYHINWGVRIGLCWLHNLSSLFKA